MSTDLDGPLTWTSWPKTPAFLWVCERCGRDLLSRWEKPGDQPYDAPVILVLRDDGTDTRWCDDCYYTKEDGDADLREDHDG